MTLADARKILDPGTICYRPPGDTRWWARSPGVGTTWITGATEEEAMVALVFHILLEELGTINRYRRAQGLPHLSIEERMREVA